MVKSNGKYLMEIQKSLGGVEQFIKTQSGVNKALFEKIDKHQSAIMDKFDSLPCPSMLEEVTEVKGRVDALEASGDNKRKWYRAIIPTFLGAGLMWVLTKAGAIIKLFTGTTDTGG